MKKLQSQSVDNPGRDYWSCSKCNKRFSAWCDELPDYSDDNPPVCPCVNKPAGCTCESVVARYMHGKSRDEKRRETGAIFPAAAGHLNDPLAASIGREKFVANIRQSNFSDFMQSLTQYLTNVTH